MMNRFTIYLLFFSLLTIYISTTKAEGPCNFVGVSECWNEILSKYCVNGVCEEDPDYCKDKELLEECFQVNCDISENRDLAWVTLFTGVCAQPVMESLSED